MAEITITIKRKSPNSAVRTPQSGGKPFFSVRGEKKPLKRRFKPSGGIRFFDLGQPLIAGIYETLPWYIAPEVNEPTTNPNIRELIAADLISRDAEIFSRDLSEYRMVTPDIGDAYLMYISNENDLVENAYGENPNWTDGGLIISDELLNSDVFAVKGLSDVGGGTTRYFSDFKLKGDDKNKITAVRDANAETVSFHPSKSDIYYMVPRTVKAEGLTYTINRMPVGVVREYRLGYVYYVFPRDMEKPQVANLTGTHPATLENTAAILYAADIVKSRPEEKLFRTDDYLNYTPEMDLDLFPQIYDDADPSYIFTSIFYELVELFGERELLCVIKQGAQTFYVWS